ncbi:hypothetical protein Ciccas_013427, partial [Cichlidogyrus casuarinus]
SICPQWKNDADVLAALRASNYSIDNCIDIYQATMGKYPKSAHSSFFNTGNEEKTVVSSLNKDLDQMRTELSNLKKSFERVEASREALSKKNDDLTQQLKKTKEQLAKTEADFKQSSLAMSGKTKRVGNAQEFKFAQSLIEALKSALCNLQEDQNSLKKSTEGQLGELATAFPRLLEAVGQQEKELKSVRALYRQEAQVRKALYNNLIELNGNIRVFCRVRPATKQEKEGAWFQPDSKDNVINLLAVKEGARKKYEFDRVFTDKTSQEQIFGSLSDIIASCVDGYNICIIAYGQTGSGKTHTMEGTAASPGVNIRAMRELLKLIENRENVSYQLELVIVEIYNEQVVDLLKSTPEVVELRQSGLQNVTTKSVVNEAEIQEVIALGNKNRKVASTKMNSSSSRSHLIVCVYVTGVDSVSGNTLRGRLVMCDLAGSERVKKSGTTSGERFQEATAINMSLSCLGQVFSALRQHQLHVPYRNSKLTQFLQPCLGGDSK